jgi:Sulfotransferase family
MRRADLGARTVLLLAREPAGDDPVLVFHHIRKTGGTSLKKVLERQLEPIDRRDIWPPHDQGHPPRSDVASWYRLMWDRVPAWDRARLRCVASHSANYFEPLIDGPKILLTIVRDPLDRILSRYHFTQRSPETKAGKPAPMRRVIRGRSLTEIYEAYEGMSPECSEQHRLAAQFFNGQSRSLLDPICDTAGLAFSDGPTEDAEQWRERLNQALDAYAWIGLQDRFDELVARIDRGFGWTPLRKLPRSKANIGRPRLPSTPEEGDLVRRFNWLDEELYRHCAAAWPPSTPRAGSPPA